MWSNRSIWIAGYSLIFQLLFSLSITAQTPSVATEQSLNQILSNLFQHSGFPSVSKPGVLLFPGKSFGARFDHQKNEIHVEMQIIDICRNFGQDSVDALSFILAHELSHAIFEHSYQFNKSHFIDVHFNFDNNIETERSADQYGVFISKLAGYQPERVLDELLNQIYEKYNLNTQKSHSYPAKEERKKSNEKLIENVLPKVHLFEAATILTLKKEYELASLAYEQLLGFYQGPELYNNLGVCYILKAMEQFDSELDKYAYPMELDFNTGLRKIIKSRGTLTAEMRSQRNSYLLKARENFEKAITISKSYAPAYINIMCCFILMEQANQALQFANKKSRSLTNRDEKQNEELAVGIAYSVLGSRKARSFFEKAKKGRSVKSRKFAEYNLSLLKSEVPSKSNVSKGEAECSLWSRFSSYDKSYNQWKPVNKYPIGTRDQQLYFSYELIGTGLKYFFYHSDKPLLTIERYRVHGVEKNSFNELDQLNVNELLWFETGKGTYLECEQSGVLYLLGKHNQVLENIELYCH